MKQEEIIPAFCNRYYQNPDVPGEFCTIQQAIFGG
jgi:hypothetical protein